jgi:hypothetical protein
MLLHFGVDPLTIHQSEFDATPSYVEVNAAAFAEECRLILEREAVTV